MKKKAGPPTDFSALRRLAEEKFKQRHARIPWPAAAEDITRLVQEMQIHQIELELQNEELEKARAEMESLLTRCSDLYDFAPVGYFSLSTNGTVMRINLRGAQLLGFERDQLIGSRFGAFVEQDCLVEFNTFLAKVFLSQEKQVCEVALQGKGLEPFWVQIEASAMEDRNECRVVVVDVDARKQAEIKLLHSSMHDALTGLYNRSYFVESIERLEGGRQFPISILMADIDRLKEKNDQLGHAFGDAFLKRAAQVLSLAFRSEDVVARIGGDEFAVLLPNTNEAAAEIALRRLKELLKEDNARHHPEIPLNLSVGIATAENGETLMETLKVADANMYQHKKG